MNVISLKLLKLEYLISGTHRIKTFKSLFKLQDIYIAKLEYLLVYALFKLLETTL